MLRKIHTRPVSLPPPKKEIALPVLIQQFPEPIRLPPLRHLRRVDETEKLVAELREDVKNITIMETEDISGIWDGSIKLIQKLILTQDPKEFLHWDIIAHTMGSPNPGYFPIELNYLKSKIDWNTRWRSAIREISVGNPSLSPYYRESSGMLVHHAYGLAKFEETVGKQIQTFEYVLEFGGGYGSMCRLFYNLGFGGKYILYDLPILSELQKFFLKSAKFPVLTLDEFIKADSGIVCISDKNQLLELIKNHTKLEKELFVATWSLSEAPTSTKNLMLSLVSDFNYFFLAYQSAFCEEENISFFEKWKQVIKNIFWKGWEIEFAPDNYYLMGTPKVNQEIL